ncbi:hypothetical protein QR46_4230 [Giardia duodenalis assemblage B]|uniref:Uncharacterized protein n=3 Tax=Giardia intestinalis TaxID=5741 RepID=A0A132NP48_GIAIN|nr:Hypothetical protein GL50581_1963 [Giardia intestinalis ATCC 50581]ESU44475.1 Hypothetical protein GSB_151831 [Giardia intestinalis]KWX11798.1 hypothetical protein QR46_4230 [Giardia intestinalis assemblage B]
MEPRPKLRFKRPPSTTGADVSPNTNARSHEHPPIPDSPVPQSPTYSELDLWRQRMAVRIAAALQREKERQVLVHSPD